MNALASLKKQLIKENLDAVLISKPENVSYLSAFTGDESYLLITREKDFFITDSRFTEQAKREAKAFNINVVGPLNHFQLIADITEKNKLSRIGFESRHLTYAQTGKIRDLLKRQEFIPLADFVERLRIIKSPAEIKKIKKAAQIGEAVLKDVGLNIKPGNKEKDLAAFIEYQMRMRGATGASFDIIVLSGKNSTMPHGRPSEKLINGNELVLIDAGARFDGYNSDLTRVYFLGKIPPIVRRIYDVVKKAQDMAIKAAKPGVKASAVDAIARGFIKKHGWGGYFGHSLGHGVGREVHEAPWISPNSSAVLAPGMVFTIEPGIYAPGIGGIRLEEMILLTENGSEVLSR